MPSFANCTIAPSFGIGNARVFRDTPHGIGVSPAALDLNDNSGQTRVGVACLGGFVVFKEFKNGSLNWFQTPLIGTVAGWGGFNSTVEFADSHTIYVGSENPGSGARVAKSTDGGHTFTRMDGPHILGHPELDLPNVPVNRLLVSPTDGTSSMRRHSWASIARRMRAQAGAVSAPAALRGS